MLSVPSSLQKESYINKDFVNSFVTESKLAKVSTC